MGYSVFRSDASFLVLEVARAGRTTSRGQRFPGMCGSPTYGSGEQHFPGMCGSPHVWIRGTVFLWNVWILHVWIRGTVPPMHVHFSIEQEVKLSGHRKHCRVQQPFIMRFLCACFLWLTGLAWARIGHEPPSLVPAPAAQKTARAETSVWSSRSGVVLVMRSLLFLPPSPHSVLVGHHRAGRVPPIDRFCGTSVAESECLRSQQNRGP